jgi:hypothetical protein
MSSACKGHQGRGSLAATSTLPMHHQAHYKQHYLHQDAQKPLILSQNERLKMTHQQILLVAALALDRAAGRLDMLSQPV